jgi:hypothetical protein
MIFDTHLIHGRGSEQKADRMTDADFMILHFPAERADRGVHCIAPHLSLSVDTNVRLITFPKCPPMYALAPRAQFAPQSVCVFISLFVHVRSFHFFSPPFFLTRLQQVTALTIRASVRLSGQGYHDVQSVGERVLLSLTAPVVGTSAPGHARFHFDRVVCTGSIFFNCACSCHFFFLLPSRVFVCVAMSFQCAITVSSRSVSRGVLQHPFAGCDSEVFFPCQKPGITHHDHHHHHALTGLFRCVRVRV